MDSNKASNCSSPKNGGGKAPGFAPPVKSEHLPSGKKLTKDLVLSKSKGGNLGEIKKIVVWGQKITDCSIVTEIPELEVASMNANKISSLEHFGQCPNLRELFLRSNCIEDIHEIYYLKELPNLQVLWLAGNPCTKHPRYRGTVIRNLEQLQKLDDTEISLAEVRAAVLRLIRLLDQESLELVVLTARSRLEKEAQQQQQQQAGTSDTLPSFSLDNL